MPIEVKSHGKQPHKWSQQPCLYLNAIGVAARDLGDRIDLHPVIPDLNKTATLLCIDLTPSLIDTDHLHVVW